MIRTPESIRQIKREAYDEQNHFAYHTITVQYSQYRLQLVIQQDRIKTCYGVYTEQNLHPIKLTSSSR